MKNPRLFIVGLGEYNDVVMTTDGDVPYLRDTFNPGENYSIPAAAYDNVTYLGVDVCEGYLAEAFGIKLDAGEYLEIKVL